MIISGAEDYIISCNNQSSTAFGSPLMTKVTGMGCTATAITGAFAAVNCDPHSAAFHSMATMSIVGSLTAKNCNAPGSFAVRFIDNLYLLNREMIMQIVHHD